MVTDRTQVDSPSSSTPEPAPASRDPSALVGTILADRYRVEELLGQGGMGTVYRAQHIHMRRKVALKVLHPEIAAMTDIAARFEREAIAVGRIEHPNVAKAMDFGRLPDGSFYLVIEYVKGKSLTELVKRGPLAPLDALEVARQIAEAINAAHQAGVVHRDLKPDNVMLADRGGLGFAVKVLDFGVAKLAVDEASGGSPITRQGAILGTFEYMAPEQAGGGAVDHRADLYALGVILYELLSGRPPFSGDEPFVIISKHFVEPPPALPATITEKTAALVFELLAKDPDSRIQSGAVLVERIDQARAEIEQDAAVSHPEPPAIVDAPASQPTTQLRWQPRAIALAVLGLTVVTALAAALATHQRSNDTGATAAGEPSPTSGGSNQTVASKPSALKVVPQLRASALYPAQPTPAKPEAAQETEAPAKSQVVAVTNSAARPKTPQKSVSAPRSGRKVVIRRRVVRRTVITTTR